MMTKKEAINLLIEISKIEAMNQDDFSKLLNIVINIELLKNPKLKINKNNLLEEAISIINGFNENDLALFEQKFLIFLMVSMYANAEKYQILLAYINTCDYDKYIIKLIINTDFILILPKEDLLKIGKEVINKVFTEKEIEKLIKDELDVEILNFENKPIIKAIKMAFDNIDSILLIFDSNNSKKEIIERPIFENMIKLFIIKNKENSSTITKLYDVISSKKINNESNGNILHEIMLNFPEYKAYYITKALI